MSRCPASQNICWRHIFDRVDENDWGIVMIGAYDMKRDFENPDVNGDAQNERRITAFTAIKQDYGFQIKVAGCVSLQAAQNGSENVIGIVELDDQVVPILDSRKETCSDIRAWTVRP